jgi:hypothetical protein
MESNTTAKLQPMRTYELEKLPSTKTQNNVHELRDLLGHDVLLLHWPLGSKGTRKKWGHLTIESMHDPDYLEKLSTGNVGVALGAKSNGLCAVDIDRDELVEPFLASNPRLSGTLQTHGSRGRVFWLRMLGDYPATFDLKTHAGAKACTKAGEWRGNGAQSIIAGRHPGTRRPYRILVKKQPLEISFSEINFSWLEQTAETTRNGNFAEPLLVHINSHRLTSVDIRSHLLHPKPDPKSDVWGLQIKGFLPTGTHQNHKLLFDMARSVKGIEQRTGTAASPEQLRAILNRWYEQAKEFCKPELSRDDYHA